jgi:hypothetical protein
MTTLSSLKRLFRCIKNIDARDEYGNTALMNAACMGKRADAGKVFRVKALIALGAKVNATREEGETALMMAAEGSKVLSVKALIAAGADVNTRREDGSTAIMFAANDTHNGADCISAIIAAGADVNAMDEKGNTALMVAAGRTNVSSVKALITAGADVNAIMKDGDTALMVAARSGRWCCVKELVDAGANVSAKDKHGNMAFEFAAMKHMADIHKREDIIEHTLGKTIWKNGLGSFATEYDAFTDFEKHSIMEDDKLYMEVAAILFPAKTYAPPKQPAKSDAPPPQTPNLLRWEQSGFPQKWVEDHHGQWTHSDWLDLLEKLKRTEYWPMDPDSIGRVIEEKRKCIAQPALNQAPQSSKSEYWKCPRCGGILQKGAGAMFAQVIGTATCAGCGTKFSQSDIYGGKYDVEERLVEPVFKFRIIGSTAFWGDKHQATFNDEYTSVELEWLLDGTLLPVRSTMTKTECRELVEGNFPAAFQIALRSSQRLHLPKPEESKGYTLAIIKLHLSYAVRNNVSFPEAQRIYKTAMNF